MKKTILTFALMFVFLAVGVLAVSSSYTVDTFATNYNNFSEYATPVDVTLTPGYQQNPITAIGAPMATFNNVPSGELVNLAYHSQGYKDADFFILFDPKLDSISGNQQTLAHTNQYGYEFITTCVLQDPAEDMIYKCTEVNNGIERIYYYSKPHNRILVRTKLVKEAVSQETTPPVINAFTVSQSSGQAPLEVTFTMDVSDDQGINSIIIYFMDGHTYRIDPVNQAATYTGTVSHTYNTAGTYNAMILVTDKTGLTSFREQPVAVTPLPVDHYNLRIIKPVAGEVLFGNAVVEWASDNVPGLIYDAYFQVIGGQWNILLKDMSDRLNLTWNTASPEQDGSYAIKIVARLGSVIEEALSGSFFIDNVNQAPAADAGADKSVRVGVLTALDGSASTDPDKRAEFKTLSYAWTQVSGPTSVISNANSAVASFTPAAAGTYTFMLTVSDGTNTATDTIIITATADGGHDDEDTDTISGYNRDIFVGRIKANENQVYFKPGEKVDISVAMSSEQDKDIDQAKVFIIAPKLRLFKEFGPFKIEQGDLAIKEVQFKIPQDAKPGTYELRTIIVTEHDQRVKIREIKIN